MASKEKVQQFMDAAGLMEANRIMAQSMTGVLAPGAAGTEADSHRLARIRTAIDNRVESALKECAEELLMDLLTDTEVDQLIVIHASPVYRKLRALRPQIVCRMLARGTLLAPEIEKMVKDMMAD